MKGRAILTTEAGAPVDDNQRSQTAGPGGPTLLQDNLLLEKLARLNRERIPERVVHAVGTGAHGYLECTSAAVPQWTRMAVFSKVGKRTPVFVRFSSAAGSKGAADTARDPRGFAIKTYSEDGNWDLVGLSFPVFFVRDGIKFTDLLHSQKYDPHTNRQEPDNIWNFFSHTPEAMHEFTMLFGDRGIPASYRHMDGFGLHTFAWANARAERFWVKFHFTTDQGVRWLTSEQAAVLGGKDPSYLHKEFYDAIKHKEFPSWTVRVQVMPEKDAAGYRFNPFDATKVWPHKDHPLMAIGKLVLDRVPDNYFSTVEQAAFNSSSFVLGIGASPDRVLQARLFAYGDAQRYRLGVNNTLLPVNSPKGVAGGAVANYNRDGAMRFDSNGGAAPNYEPNSLDGPAETGNPYDFSQNINGQSGRALAPHHSEDDDFGQPGALYRAMKEDERQRLVENIADNLAMVSRQEVIDRSLEHFRKTDPDYGMRVAAAVAKRKVSK